MARPLIDESRPKTKERLLIAAGQEFARCGFAGARLSDIAKGAGINRSSLLYHFSSKQGLYEATVQHGFDELSVMLRDSITMGVSFSAQLELLSRRFASFLDEQPQLSQLIVRELLAGQGPGWTVVMSRVVPMLDQVEEFIHESHGEALGLDFPVREALMQIISNHLLKAACPGLREALWGCDNDPWVLPKMLFRL